MVERGIWNHQWNRQGIRKPNCKPLIETAHSLGMEKFASLFVFYLIGLIISLIILVMENIIKPEKSGDLICPHDNAWKIIRLKMVLRTLTDKRETKLYLLNEVKLHLLKEIKSQE